MPNQKFFMGLDVGTSGVKAVLFDENGRQKSIAQKEYQFTHPQPGYSVLDPAEVWRKTAIVIKECVSTSALPIDKITAIGLSVLGETTLVVDENGQPLYPAIDSQDKRANAYQQYLEWFDSNFGKEEIYRRTSFPVSFIAPVLRLQWFRDFQPELFNQIAKFITFQDFTLHQLTGKYAIDYSMASRSMVFDTQHKYWIGEYIDAIGVDQNIFSKACLPTGVVGHLSEAAAREVGLHPGVLVVAGAHDQSCSALGVGAIKEGIAADGTGSVEAIATPTQIPFTSPHLEKLGFSSECHLTDDLYLALGYHLTAGSLVRWYRKEMSKHEEYIARSENKDVYNIITDAADTSPPGANGLLVLPHWSGAGTGRIPLLNPHSRGAIIGLTLAHNKADIDRAVFEGITYEARIIIDSFINTGIKINEFVVTGGGAKSPFWLQLKADILGKPMKVPETTEASAMGAAMLAAVGSGFVSSLEEIVDRFCRIRKTYTPDLKNARVYERQFKVYNELYGALVGINSELSLLV